MRVVVAGASGFVGSALVRACRDAGIDVLPVARSARPSPGLIVVPDYSHTPPGDVLVHLAESRDLALAEAEGEAHIARAVSVAQGLLAIGFRRVVYASSGVVYGDQVDSPRRPEEQARPRGVYARGKLAVERLVLGHPSGVVARLANVYGAGMADNNVLADILAQVPGTGPVYVRDAAPVRDFIEVLDAAIGLMALATGSATGVYNLGCGIGYAVSDLVRIACDQFGQSGRPVVSTAPSGRASTLILDVASTYARFGWRPTIGMGDGIRELVAERR